MCFVWISEQTAIISLYSINCLVCTTKRKRVYCAARAASWVRFTFLFVFLQLSIKKQHTLGKCWGILFLLARLMYSSQYAFGRSCDRSSRHRFSWFSSVFKHAEVVPKIPSCFSILLILPSRFKFTKINLLALKQGK